MARRRYYFQGMPPSGLQRHVSAGAYVSGFGNVMISDLEVAAGEEDDADAYAESLGWLLLTANPVGSPEDAALGDGQWCNKVDLWVTANDTLSGLAARGGATPSDGWRVIVSGQTTDTEDGVYIARAGAWDRAEDALPFYGMAGSVWYVARGTHAGKIVKCTNAPGSDLITVNGLTIEDAAPAGGGGGAAHSPGAAFGDGTNAGSLAVGQIVYVRVPYSGTISRWDITADVACTAQLDVWKLNNAVPSVANTITASAKPSLSAQATAGSSTLTGWTTAVAVGDVFAFRIDSLSGGSPKQITLALLVS